MGKKRKDLKGNLTKRVHEHVDEIEKQHGAHVWHDDDLIFLIKYYYFKHKTKKDVKKKKISSITISSSLPHFIEMIKNIMIKIIFLIYMLVKNFS